MQVLEIIRSSLNLIGAFAPGQSIPAYISSSAMAIFNTMLDEWAGQRLTLYVTERKLYPLVANQGGPTNPYTLGPGGDFNQARPMFVDRASVIDNNNAAQPLELSIQILSTQQWQAIPTKEVYTTLPQSVYFEPTFPLVKGFLYCIPQVDYLDLALYLPRAVPQVAALTDDVVLPPGYQGAIIYNLALRLSPQMGRPIEPWLVSEARAKLGWVKSNNISMTELSNDSQRWGGKQRTGLYNWINDEGGY